MMGMMPGMNKMAKQMDQAGLDDKILRQQIALIQSMTKRERANPQLLQASRKKRIAAGCGQEVSDINRLLKMHREMSKVMKQMGKQGKGGIQRAMPAMIGGGAGGPASLGAPRSMDRGKLLQDLSGLAGLGPRSPLDPGGKR